MALGQSALRVVKSSSMWLYCWLRILLSWIVKMAANSVIKFRLWLRNRGQKKSLFKLGRAVHQVHLGGGTDWSDDSQVNKILQELEAGDRKRDDLEALLQAKEELYRGQVKRFREAQSSRPKQSAGESTADSGQQAAGSQ